MDVVYVIEFAGGCFFFDEGEGVVIGIVLEMLRWV
jgi:hypothetical protein